jgi:glutaredoxin-like YruB-family protein
MITVYSIPNCPWCHKVKKYLELKEEAFTEINVEEDEEGRAELLKLTNQLNVPVANINKNIVIGFDKEKIDEYLALK